MSRTTITHPDGTQTTVDDHRSGCGGCLTIAAVLFVVAAPAATFPLWGAILAYLFEAIILIAWLVQRASARQA